MLMLCTKIKNIIKTHCHEEYFLSLKGEFEFFNFLLDLGAAQTNSST